MASKEYWDELMKRFNSMSDEEFKKLVEKCEREPEIKFMIVDDEGDQDGSTDND